MEEKHRQLLHFHRFKFTRSVDGESLIPALLADEVLTVDDALLVRKEASKEAATEKLLDIIADKGGKRAFHSLCLALETTYPHILTVMFLGSSSDGGGSREMSEKSESTTTVHTSDSEVEELAKHDSDKESFSLDLLSSVHKNFGSQGSSRLFSTPSPLSPTEYETNVAVLKELKLISHGRDTLSKELKKAQTERGISSHRLIMSSGDSALNRIGTLTKQHGVSNSDKSLSCPSRDYDWLKSQCDKAMSELQSLRRQHTETIRRCDAAMKDSEYYRLKHKQAISKLDKQQTEALTLRACYNEVLADKHHLEQEVGSLKKFREEDRVEVAELRQHQQESLGENGNSEAINQMYSTAVKKYESIKEDYDNLRKRYTEVIASRAVAISKLEPVQDELVQLRKRHENVSQERDNIVRERNGLKQQCTAAIHQWDNALRELNEVKEALAKVQQQRDEAMKEINQAMAVRIKATKDLARLTEQRNAAVQEYSLVMLERDSVHKEIEKLQEELAEASKKAKGSDQQRKAIAEEVEILRREITSALHDRDRALKECNDLREKYGDFNPGHEDGSGARDDARRDDNSRREAFRRSGIEGADRHDSTLNGLEDGDNFDKVQKERLENLDQANQELERLQKQLEKLQLELTEAQQEGEVSKRRRDWAFSERDKIVLERESIRTLCDKLRKERDRAVSELAESIRDSDDIKKQRNEASRELKELREKIEAQVEKETRMKQLHAIGHNHSRDSAIDADLQEWETETLEFNLSDVNGVGSLGFDLAGGKDDPQYPDSLIFISHIAKGSIAKRKLKVNDMLLQVNDIDLTNADRSIAYEALHSSDGIVNMVIRRRRSVTSHFVQAVQLNLVDGKDHGISLESGMYISRIAQGSAAAKEGSIALGDRVFSINGKSLEGVSTPDEGLKLLEGGGEIVTLGIVKCIGNPSTSVSSSSSGHNIVENIDGDKNCSPQSCSAGGSPVKDLSMRSNYREPVKKLTNSSSQTEDYLTKKQIPCHSAQQTFLDRAYQKFRERRGSKNNDKKSNNVLSSNSSSSPSNEGAVMAELDSVIEHFKKNSVPSTSSKSRRKKLKEQDKNGGTWPRCKGPPVVYIGPCIGTISTPHKKKERKSIASLMNPPKLPPSYSKSCESPEHRLNNRVSSAALSDHGVPYTIFGSPPMPPASTPVSVIHNSGPFLSSPKSPFRPPSSTSGKKGALDGKMTDVSNDQLLSGSLHYSTASSLNSSLDYSVVSANKDVLAYYSNKGKTRPKSALYPQSDNESLRATEISMKPMSIDIQTLCRKPVHISSSSMSSAHSILSTPTTLNMSPHLSDRTAQSIPHTALFHSPTNGIAYYAIPSSRIHYSHAHPHTTISCTSPTMTSPRYSSPSTVSYTSKSGESLLSSSIPESPLADARACHRGGGEGYMNNSASTSPYSFTHSPSHSLEFYHYHHPIPKRIVNKHPHSIHREDPGFFIPYDVSSTFPKRTSQRVQIPANQSVMSRSSMGKISSSSIDKVSVADRGSPVSSFRIEVLNPANSMPTFGDNVSEPGLRSVVIEKSSEPLGIQIDGGPQGGIFVSSVSEHSLASQAGLRIGDQLLEVCGINMRSATYLLAANVLRQCGNSITMLVQYSPEKYKEIMRTSGSSSNSTGNSSSDASPIPTPTPSNSPKYSDAQNLELTETSSLSSSKLKRSSKASRRSSHSDERATTHVAQSHEPRRLVLKPKTTSLGISILGGNAVGIFVHAIQPDSLAAGPNGLRCGDQILEYNGADLRSATAEQAAAELAKSTDTVSILTQSNYARYLEIQDQAGDSFYLRALFDRAGESSEELSFRKDDILYVDNTMLNGVTGMWRAWLVNEDGQKQRWGIIPSKCKVEEELLLKQRSLADLDADPSSRRGSTSARRSFFRRKKHQRSNSRDSKELKELASFSDASINSHSDSATLLEENLISSYQRVEKLEHVQLRPVLIIGPLLEAVVDKLTQDFPHKFQRCHSELVYASVDSIEKGVQDNVYVYCRRRANHFECITTAAVKEVCDKNTHCIIDISPKSVERLQRQRIFPIVLFMKFKSTKQIREVKDSTFLTEKVSTKAAKEMYEHSLKMESDYKHLISGTIPGGSLAYMCAQIEASVDQEQSKLLWASAGTI